MTRFQSSLIAAVLLAGVAVAGCKKHEDATADTGALPPAATTMAPMPAPSELPPAAGTTSTAPMATPPPTSAIVSSVDLGSAVGADNKVTRATTTFAKNDTIHASVATTGGKASTLTARWNYQDGQVVHTEDKSVPAGAHVTDFSISKPDGWPAGDYKLEVLVDGNVAQTVDFSVK
jgi:hypothetical protein